MYSVYQKQISEWNSTQIFKEKLPAQLTGPTILKILTLLQDAVVAS